MLRDRSRNTTVLDAHLHSGIGMYPEVLVGATPASTRSRRTPSQCRSARCGSGGGPRLSLGKLIGAGSGVAFHRPVEDAIFAFPEPTEVPGWELRGGERKGSGRVGKGTTVAPGTGCSVVIGDFSAASRYRSIPSSPFFQGASPKHGVSRG
ncbi:hypothetical protein MTO96_035635 [Rhipicephalus appendiculatus]